VEAGTFANSEAPSTALFWEKEAEHIKGPGDGGTNAKPLHVATLSPTPISASLQ
jgi:hypothetical protein